MAGRSVSRILSGARPSCGLRAWAIIPLVPALLPGSSGLPEGLTGRASPSLLFGLAPRGVYLAAPIARGAVGSYPTISPLPALPGRSGRARGFASSLPSRPGWRGRYGFCGTVRNRTLASPTPWRYQARCPAESGLSSGQASRKKPARDHPTCPPSTIIEPPARRKPNWRGEITRLAHRSASLPVCAWQPERGNALPRKKLTPAKGNLAPPEIGGMGWSITCWIEAKGPASHERSWSRQARR